MNNQNNANDDSIIAKAQFEQLLAIKQQRTFAFSYLKEHSVKRKITLHGPLLLIKDKEKLVQPLTIYLPQWSINMQTVGNHATLFLYENINNSNKELKIKSRKEDVITSWWKTMFNVVEQSKNIVVDSNEFAVKYLNNGAYIRCKLSIMFKKIKIIHKGTLINVLRRTPDFIAYPAFDEPLKIFLTTPYKKVVIKCKDENTLVRAVVSLNAKYSEESVVQNIQISDAYIPDIDTSSLLPDDKNLLIQTETKEEIIERMMRKYKHIVSNMTIAESHDVNEVLEEITSKTYERTKYRKKFDPYSDIIIPAKYEEYPVTPKFKVENNDITHFLFDTSLENLSKHKMKDVVNDDKQAKKERTIIDNLLKNIEETDWAYRPLIATSIFLHNRKLLISEMYEIIRFSRINVDELELIILRNIFYDERTCFTFFTELFKKGLAQMFFELLPSFNISPPSSKADEEESKERLTSSFMFPKHSINFIQVCYYDDALLKINNSSLCHECTKYFNSSVHDAQYSPILFKYDVDTERRVKSFVNEIKQNQLMLFIEDRNEQDNEQRIFSVFTPLLVSLVSYLCKRNNEALSGNLNCINTLIKKTSIDHGYDADTYSLLYFNSDDERNMKAVTFLINAIINGEITIFIIDSLHIKNVDAKGKSENSEYTIYIQSKDVDDEAISIMNEFNKFSKTCFAKTIKRKSALYDVSHEVSTYLQTVFKGI